MKVELLHYTPDPEKVIEGAARISYGSKAKGPKERARFIRRLIKMGHCSVLEHAQATFLIEDCSIACSRQLLRHRHLSAVEQSLRRVEHYETIKPPSSVMMGYEATRTWQRAIDQAQEAYRRLRELGVPREDARLVLPLATTTRLVVTTNFREWRHVLKLRLDKASQWEIREVAEMILERLVEIAPSVFIDLKEVQDGNKD